MKKSFAIILSIILLYMVQGCTTHTPTADELKLSWQIISNEYAEIPKVKAKFIIENKSQFKFSESNWALFYNQAPRQPLGSNNHTKIEHISGDWFKISPETGFKLKPGESKEITYESEAWYIKESDAAVGPYFVFYDKNGNETDIVAVNDYAILPFTEPEHVNRHKNDAEPIPTAAWQYNQNLNLKKLDREDLLPIIPSPVSAETSGNKVIFDGPVDLYYEKGLENEANYLSLFLQKMFGDTFNAQEAKEPKSNSIFLGKKSGLPESYTLEVNNNQSIVIRGGDAAGVFYGIQSLIGLIPTNLFISGELPVVLTEIKLNDAPRFSYRGMQLDVSRNFQTKETVKKVIDILAFYKINHLLFYITEDEGWRLEIEELPELTDVGSHRGHTTKEANALHPSYGSGPEAYAEGSFGSGYYSREEFIEILRYAQSRHIKVIPEIGFPGHARAAIKAMEARYKKYMAAGDEEKANEYRLIDPEETSKYRSAQWYSDNIVNVARESTYKFYETVIDDVIEMYKEAGVALDYLHTGGDEVPEGSWSASPMCAELMKKYPEYKDPRNLQAYGTRRIIEILNRKELKIAGWEEIGLLKDKNGRYNPNPEFAGQNVYPYVWNNLGVNTDLNYRLANAGYPVIMCNVSSFYFDLAYNKDPREPGLYWGGMGDVRDAWQVATFNLFKTTTHTAMGAEIDMEKEYAGMERIQPHAKKNIIGVQAQLWAETIMDGEDDLMRHILPKLPAFAETAWAPEREWEGIDNKTKREASWDKEWNVFANTLAEELPKYKTLFGGYNYRVPTPGGKIIDGKLHANSTYPGLTIRYTTDGREPDIKSTLYKAPVEVSGKVRIKAFDAAGKGSFSMEVR